MRQVPLFILRPPLPQTPFRDTHLVTEPYMKDLHTHGTSLWPGESLRGDGALSTHFPH